MSENVKNINVAIVDDNLKDQAATKEALIQYQKDTPNVKFDISFFDDGNKFLNSNVHSYDIVFMDMIMPSFDGIQTSLSLRKVSMYTNIIIVSSSPDFAIKGYSVDALGYVLKPINYKFMKTIVDKAISNIKNNEEAYIVLNVQGEKKKILMRDILYTEVMNHDLIIVTNEGQIRTRLSLEEFSAKYSRYGFSKCHRCYLVNLKHVTSFNNNEVIVGEYTIPLSRLRKKQFEEDFYDFLGESI